MTTEERKIELINWIRNLNNDSVLKRIEEFKSSSGKDIPSEILEILEYSDDSDQSMVIHTSAKDLLK